MHCWRVCTNTHQDSEPCVYYRTILECYRKSVYKRVPHVLSIPVHCSLFVVVVHLADSCGYPLFADIHTLHGGC